MSGPFVILMTMALPVAIDQLVAHARTDPRGFSAALRGDLDQLDPGEQRRALGYVDDNPRLRVHVVRLAASLLRRIDPPLTVEELDRLTEVLRLARSPERPELVALLDGDTAGHRRLVTLLDGPLPLALDVARGLRADGDTERAQRDATIWRAYLLTRGPIATGDAVGYILQHPHDFAARLAQQIDHDAAHDAVAASDVSIYAAGNDDAVRARLVAWAQGPAPRLANLARESLFGLAWQPLPGALDGTVLVLARAALPSGDARTRRSALTLLAQRPGEHALVEATLQKLPARDDLAAAQSFVDVAGMLEPKTGERLLAAWLRALDKRRFADAAWQPSIERAGNTVERARAISFGFSEPQMPCPSALGRALENAEDRAILANQPPPAGDAVYPGPAPQLVAQRLLAARGRMVHGKPWRQ
jgi:hypothetical protein